MYWSGVVALLGWAATTVAQGNLGGDQSASCSASQNFVYVGCYDNGQNGGNANFPFRLVTNAGDPKSYPGFTSQTQLTADLCNTACRGHGFPYSGTTFGEECYCSSRLPYPQPPPSGSTSSGLGPYFGSNPGGTVPNDQCSTPCPGNNTQTCGGYGTLQVYRDPTFAPDATLPTRGAPENYLYFGCYSNAGPGPQFLDIRTPNTTNCQTYCGLLGYTYSIRGDTDLATSNNCGCGPELPGGLQIAETSCDRFCNGTLGASGGAGSCGGNGAFSVYRNPQIGGCYVVRQPGNDASHTYVAPANAGVACTAPICGYRAQATVTSSTVSSTFSSPTTSASTSPFPPSSSTASASSMIVYGTTVSYFVTQTTSYVTTQTASVTVVSYSNSFITTTATIQQTLTTTCANYDYNHAVYNYHAAYNNDDHATYNNDNHAANYHTHNDHNHSVLAALVRANIFTSHNQFPDDFQHFIELVIKLIIHFNALELDLVDLVVVVVVLVVVLVVVVLVKLHINLHKLQLQLQLQQHEQLLLLQYLILVNKQQLHHVILFYDLVLIFRLHYHPNHHDYTFLHTEHRDGPSNGDAWAGEAKGCCLSDES
ncbi:MAG: hypothetical protein Q9196_000575 [Gyalolechia fulgens]